MIFRTAKSFATIYLPNTIINIHASVLISIKMVQKKEACKALDNTYTEQWWWTIFELTDNKSILSVHFAATDIGSKFSIIAIFCIKLENLEHNCWTVKNIFFGSVVMSYLWDGETVRISLGFSSFLISCFAILSSFTYFMHFRI